MAASAAIDAIETAGPSRCTMRSAASSRASRRASRSGSGTAVMYVCSSGDLHAGDRPADDQPLDLAGPLEDRVDLGVAVPALDGVLPRVAVAAADLDRVLGDAHGDLRGLVLAHRAFAVLVAAVAGQPGGPPDQEARGVDLDGHVRQLEGDRLVHDDRPPEGLALLGVLQRVLVRGTGDAEGLGANRGAGGLERGHR